MGSTQLSDRAVGRKFVIACDGTWMNSDMGVDTSPFSPPKTQIPTNVTRIIRALNHRDENGITQIAFYQRGLGTDNFQDKIAGGLTGNDISEHIREAYAFLANNYNPETQAELDDESKPRDEIVLLGFSRGAYTARAIASLVSDMGLLTKTGMEQFWPIFGDWMKQNLAGQESAWFVAAYPDVAKAFQQKYGRKICFTDKEYRETLISKGLTRWGMPIRAVGVWDTVGSLGIPLPFNSKNVKPYSFVNTKVARAVQHAFHALAIDEHRSLFTPTLWELPVDGSAQGASLQKLKQCWFPGSHSNVGGSYPDAGMSNITLAWMISQLEDTDGGILSFSPGYLNYVQDRCNTYYSEVNEPIRPWGFGKLYDSSAVDSPLTLAQALSPIVRTPGQYCEVSDEDGKQTSTPLQGTGECVHRCVRVRIDGGGRGPEVMADSSAVERAFSLVKKAAGLHPASKVEEASYKSPALAGLELVEPPAVRVERDHATAGASGVFWKIKDGTALPEDVLGETEIRLLKRSVGQ